VTKVVAALSLVTRVTEPKYPMLEVLCQLVEMVLDAAACWVEGVERIGYPLGFERPKAFAEGEQWTALE